MKWSTTVPGVIFALAGSIVLFGAFVFSAPASAAPEPGLKVLGVAAPTHLPSEQSEVQKVTVESEGGTFKLSQVGVEGTATPVALDAELGLVKESKVATIENITGTGTVEVGDRVTLPEQYGHAYILACSSNCRTPGSTIELSEAAEATETGARRQIITRELSGVVGSFKVGEEVLDARNYENRPYVVEPFFPSGTVVTAVGPGSIKLSNPTTEEYVTSEASLGPLHLTTGPVTAPIAFDASDKVLQDALEAALGSASVTVTGGPGGNAAHPYYVEFGGPSADRDVPLLGASDVGLTGKHPSIDVVTIVQGGAGTGYVVVMPANVGGAPSSGPVTVKVGPLPPGIVTSAAAFGKNWNCPGGPREPVVICTTRQQMQVFHAYQNILDIPIEVTHSAAGKSAVDVEISGGGSVPNSYRTPIIVSDEPAPFGVQAAFGGSTEADGSPSTQAGGHPFEASTYIVLNTRRVSSRGIETVQPTQVEEESLVPSGEAREVKVTLPPGFVGSPLVGKRCPQFEVAPPALHYPGPLCNEEMTVGNLDPLLGSLRAGIGEFGSRFWNDVPPRGAAAEFSTRLATPTVSVVANVNSEEDFGIQLSAPNAPEPLKIFGVFAAFEGVPTHGSGAALLTNPTDCSLSAQSPPAIRPKADSYQEPGKFSELVLPQPAVTGCDKLRFEAMDPATGKGQVAFSFTPSADGGSQVSSGATPVGAFAHLHVDQSNLSDPDALATPHLKRTVIKLPAGMILNPSAAQGLQGCSEAQIGYSGNFFAMPTPIRFNADQPACPDGSKLGTAEIKTPLLEHPLVGEVFLAADGENPFGSLLAVYLVVNDPLTGVLIKLAGEVQADPDTGRLTAIFDDNPQLPFEDLYLRLRGGGPRSIFATSEVCGSFSTEGTMTPWSAPESGPPAETTSSFSLDSNCALTLAARPFAPSFEAGTTINKAGDYAPLVVKVDRKDGEQELTGIDFALPEGLTGKLAGIPYCPSAEIIAAERKTGRQEEDSPSCPASSQIGTVDTGAGVGSLPFHVGGKVYLSGPYKGAPVSSVAVVPAIAGPLDLGDVVIRAPLYIDRETAELTAKTDPIPTILKGIPLKIRSISIRIDRAGFILNPTNCRPMSATGTFNGASGAGAKASNRFQVAGCKGLKFAPNLKIALKGRVRRGGHPSVTAILTQPPGQANIGRISVALPHSEFLEQSHIRKNCTRVQFAAEACPAGSIYGHAEAVTPLLDQPLRGPVYLRSSSHRLPDLVAALKGPPSQPIEINLDGRIDSFRGGVRTSFESVPDAPVSKFILRLPAGKKSLLVNSADICRGNHFARIEAIGQNGLEHDFSRVLKPRCGKAKHLKKSAKSRR